MNGKEYYVLQLEKDPKRVEKIIEKAAETIAIDMDTIGFIPQNRGVEKGEISTMEWWTGIFSPTKYFNMTPAEICVVKENFHAVYNKAQWMWAEKHDCNHAFIWSIMPTEQILEEIGSRVKVEPPEGVSWALQAPDKGYYYNLIVEDNPLDVPWEEIDTYHAAFVNKAKYFGLDIK